MTTPTNVTVFGASGKIGRHVVHQLLDAGHHVTAYVRDPAKLTTTHPDLNVIVGGLDDLEAITRAVTGADAVISALGPSLRRSATGTPVADGTRRIVDAMDAAGVRRFTGLATPSVADPHDQPTIKGALLPRFARLTMPNAMTELVAMTDAVTGSDLDWTIARITNPTNRPAKGRTRAGYLGRDKVGWAMTRADIAAFLISQIADNNYSRALPAISN
ncbi:MAG: NAD(P)-dependent oxidoreductase [Acidimicrobiales bacterium]